MSRSPARRVLGPALALCLLGVCLISSSAGAHSGHGRPSPYRFKVIDEGSGTYSYEQESPDSTGITTVHADYAWRATYGKVLVPKLATTGDLDVGRVVKPRASSASGHWSISNQGGSNGDCSAGGPLSAPDPDAIHGELQGDRTKRGLSLVAGPGWFSTGASSRPDICDGSNFWQAWPIAASGAGMTADGGVFNDPLAAPVEISSAELRTKRITRDIGSATQSPLYPPVPTDCSGGGDPCAQHFDWTGTLTMVRVRGRHHGH
jgi:hypothetical protein